MVSSSLWFNWFWSLTSLTVGPRIGWNSWKRPVPSGITEVCLNRDFILLSINVSINVLNLFSGLIFFTIFNYLAAITAIVLFYVYYTQSHGCHLHKFFISFNLILCFIMSVLSILPKVQDCMYWTIALKRVVTFGGFRSAALWSLAVIPY